jgi:hypothetical protein
MDISTLEGFTVISMQGIRQPDNTINLGSHGKGANISDWPTSLDALGIGASTLPLKSYGSTPNVEGDGLETAWYQS